MKKNGFIVLSVLVLMLSISCVKQPDDRATYNLDDYRKLAMKRVIKDKFLLNVSYVTETDSGQIVDSFFHDVYTPPYKLDDDVINQIMQCSDLSKDPDTRFEMLRDCIVGDKDPIIYDPRFTLDASNCYRLKKGNCFALTNLMVGAGRLAGFDARYVLVEDIISNNEQESAIIHTNHIVCAVKIGSKQKIADFIPNPRKYRIQTVITDLEAAGLFYNNIASKFMVSGDYRNAAVIFEIAYAFFPDSYQVNNNIGVLLMKMEKPEKARPYFYRALETTRFPDLIYGNLISMMKKTGREAEISEIEANLDTIKKRNPYFYITLARKAYDNGNLEKSLKYLRTAQKLNKTIPQIYSLKSQIYEQLDDIKKKNDALNSMNKYREKREIVE